MSTSVVLFCAAYSRMVCSVGDAPSRAPKREVWRTPRRLTSASARKSNSPAANSMTNDTSLCLK